jgi:hypothetical protein
MGTQTHTNKLYIANITVEVQARAFFFLRPLHRDVRNLTQKHSPLISYMLAIPWDKESEGTVVHSQDALEEKCESEKGYTYLGGRCCARSEYREDLDLHARRRGH